MEAYSALDKLVHRMAFGAAGLQSTAADIERMVYGRKYKDILLERPIFITSLARAGTTILLEALSHFPGLATHLYRDMPLVGAPILWDKLTGPFRKDQGVSARAHGDGIMIGQESPEAFEEVLWMEGSPAHYKGRRITLWRSDEPLADLKEILEENMRKIIFLRCPEGKGRYLSKNNANIVRTDILRKLFPDCQIIVPLRDPVTHARSLHRQHANFLRQHAEDPFVKQYMGDIGHFEFGALHRPFEVPGLDDFVGGLNPDMPDYWLAYWVAVFSYVQTKLADPSLYLISSEELARNPGAGLRKIAETLGIEGLDAIGTAAALFKPLKERDSEGFREALVRQADDLHRALLASALV